MTDQKKRVFIAASSSAASSAVEQIISARGLIPISIEKDAVPGTTWVNSLHHCVKDSDMVVAILDDSKKAANVFFELGMATAFNKPTLLVIPPDYPVDNFPMSGIPYIRTNPTNADAISFGVEQILSIAPQRIEGQPQIKGKALSGAADEYLKQLTQVKNEVDFEKLIYEVLKATGIDTVARGIKAEDQIVDLAVWSSDLEPTVGNPLLIECKQTLASTASINEMVGRMLRSLDAIRNGYGLVIFQHTHLQKQRNLPQSFPFVFIAAEDFINGLRTTDFASFVRGLRNAFVHGK